jgi:ABC-type antimicrobial peptide transport system permease subunit
VRTEVDAQDVAPSILQTLREFSSEVRIRSVATIAEQLDGGLQMERLLATLLGFFGALALALAAVGMYGVMAYAVMRRSGEIGIRMVLGARRSSVLTMVLREALKLVLAGIGFGIPAALATTHFLKSSLFGLEARDPMTIVGGALVLLVVAVLAGYFPARRASRVDPMVALRHA